jgi:hypothetical protein
MCGRGRRARGGLDPVTSGLASGCAFPLVDAELFIGFSDRPQRRRTVKQPEQEVEGERGGHRWDAATSWAASSGGAWPTLPATLPAK